MRGWANPVEIDVSRARPSSPPRQLRFVAAGNWDRERVIDACREWAAQTGAPPTRDAWSPPEKLGPGARPVLDSKWEREHPAWPSTAVVYRHVGSFRELLLAAGFEAPEPITIAFAERVATARRLRAEGLRWAEIADLLGVSVNTARRYPNAHDCADCCTPILAPHARLCLSCVARNRTQWGRVFTRAEIVAAIQRWAGLEGRAPATVDWRPADRGGHPRWEQDCPRFPPPSHVFQQFGSWNAALQAAGFDRPRPRAFSDQEILRALRTWAQAHELVPLSTEWDASPHADVIASRFGTWNAALSTAGLRPRQIRRAWTEEEILDGLKRLASDLGRVPRASDRVGSGGEYPSPALAGRRFGSWNQALAAAGLDITKHGGPPTVTVEQIVEALRAYHRDHRQPPSEHGWSGSGGRPAASTIVRHCGSWQAALELAGLPGREPTDSELLDALRGYRHEFGVAPTIRSWQEAGRRPGVKLIRDRFGSWSAALQQAGLIDGSSSSPGRLNARVQIDLSLGAPTRR